MVTSHLRRRLGLAARGRMLITSSHVGSAHPLSVAATSLSPLSPPTQPVRRRRGAPHLATSVTPTLIGVPMQMSVVVAAIMRRYSAFAGFHLPDDENTVNRLVRSDHSWQQAQQLLLQLMVDSGYMADGKYGVDVRKGLNRDKRTDKAVIKKAVVEWMRMQEALLPRLSPQLLASMAGAVCDAHADRKHVNAAKRLRKYAGVLGAVRCQHCADTKRSGRVDHTASGEAAMPDVGRVLLAMAAEPRSDSANAGLRTSAMEEDALRVVRELVELNRQHPAPPPVGAGVRIEMQTALCTRPIDCNALEERKVQRRKAKVKRADVEAVPLKKGEWVCIQPDCGIRNSKHDLHCRRCHDPLRFTGGGWMLDSSGSDEECWTIDTLEDDLEPRPEGADQWVMPLLPRSHRGSFSQQTGRAMPTAYLEAGRGGAVGRGSVRALTTAGYDDTSDSDVSESDESDAEWWAEENELALPREVLRQRGGAGRGERGGRSGARGAREGSAVGPGAWRNGNDNSMDLGRLRSSGRRESAAGRGRTGRASSGRSASRRDGGGEREDGWWGEEQGPQQVREEHSWRPMHSFSRRGSFSAEMAGSTGGPWSGGGGGGGASGGRLNQRRAAKVEKFRQRDDRASPRRRSSG